MTGNGEGARGKLVRTYRDLEVYQIALEAAMEVFQLSRSFPKSETFGLTSQILRSSRSVVTNVAEAWRKRRYKAAFISKLSDAETEAGETQVWLEIAAKCGYLNRGNAGGLYRSYEGLLGKLVRMIDGADRWIIKPAR